jgi:hypothetical protein
MKVWYWLAGILALLAIPAALYGLHRLGLWLEDRGWLYYCRKKPESSPASMWVAMQQLIEPGVKHVHEVRNRRALLACISDCLDTNSVNAEGVRLYLAAAQEAGLDWRELYAEAVQAKVLRHPDQVDRIPPVEDVSPPD